MFVRYPSSKTIVFELVINFKLSLIFTGITDLKYDLLLPFPPLKVQKAAVNVIVEIHSQLYLLK